MGYVATDLAKVPAEGFDWYLFLLTDSWKDPIQDDLLGNFDQLVTAVGTECLVVRGANPEAFYNRLVDTQLGKLAGLNRGSTTFPSLVLSSHSLKQMEESSGAVDENIVVLIIPLRLKRDLHEFMRELARTIKTGDPSTVFGDQPESKWAWLSDYLVLKPTFCGLGVDLNPLFSKIVGAKA